MEISIIEELIKNIYLRLVVMLSIIKEIHQKLGMKCWSR